MDMGAEKVLYFAYGSNLLFARLFARTPSIRNLGVAKLQSHRMSFNKPGGDGSGKCGIEQGESHEFVLGVLYEMNLIEKPILDEIEGVGHGYFNKWVTVEQKGNAVEAFTYYPSRIDDTLVPYDWYKAFVLTGALENKFPDEYINKIESVISHVDPDENRRSENFRILVTKTSLESFA